MIKSTTEQFDELMEKVPQSAFRFPTSLHESREAKIKPSPMLEARIEARKRSEDVKKAKDEASKSLTEACQKIQDLHSQFILEGVSTRIVSIAPELKAKVEAIEAVLCEAVAKTLELSK